MCIYHFIFNYLLVLRHNIITPFCTGNVICFIDGCEDKWRLYNDHCYYIAETKLNWADSQVCSYLDRSFSIKFRLTFKLWVSVTVFNATFIIFQPYHDGQIFLIAETGVSGENTD